ncbi:MAG: hypothetical protein HFI06_12930 [Eubacterium sp.]|jgi:hypothetical protein|nr:hypothetical protein [Eubacterium sp.]
MFVVFRNPNDYLKVIFDGYMNKRVLLDKDLHCPILSFIGRLHNSIKINRKCNLPFKNFWFPHYLDYNEINVAECVFFVFFEGSRVAYQKEYLSYLKSRFQNSKFIFRFVNTINQQNKWMVNFVENYYDMIISMDQCDCKKNNWVYVSNTYNIQPKITEQIKDIDVFFVGSDKGRLKKILSIYRYLKTIDLRCEFYIAEVKEEERIYGLEGIHYIKYMKYSKTLELISRSKCLLEVVQEGQVGSTMRSMEALVYRKKLLTNDKSIKSQEYFCKENMFVFEEPIDIDKDFILSKVVENKTCLQNISHDILFKKIEAYFK